MSLVYDLLRNGSLLDHTLYKTPTQVMCNVPPIDIRGLDMDEVYKKKKGQRLLSFPFQNLPFDHMMFEGHEHATILYSDDVVSFRFVACLDPLTVAHSPDTRYIGLKSWVSFDKSDLIERDNIVELGLIPLFQDKEGLDHGKVVNSLYAGEWEPGIQDILYENVFPLILQALHGALTLMKSKRITLETQPKSSKKTRKKGQPGVRYRRLVLDYGKPTQSYLYPCEGDTPEQKKRVMPWTMVRGYPRFYKKSKTTGWVVPHTRGEKECGEIAKTYDVRKN